ncbi:hypothetical protein, partial [Streptomyces sp. CO7]
LGVRDTGWTVLGADAADPAARTARDTRAPAPVRAATWAEAAELRRTLRRSGSHDLRLAPDTPDLTAADPAGPDPTAVDDRGTRTAAGRTRTDAGTAEPHLKTDENTAGGTR